MIRACLAFLLFLVMNACVFGDGILSPEEIKRLQGINDMQRFVQYKGYWYQEKYRKYFKEIEKRECLSEEESKFVGKWIEWERCSSMQPPERLTAVNGSRLYFLPDKTLVATYDSYPGSMRVYFLVARWKIDGGCLYAKNVLIAYSSDSEIHYADEENARGLGSTVILSRFNDDWYVFYSDIKKIDWKYGYTYEGFKPLRMPKELVKPYYNNLRPDSRRAVDYSVENDYLSFPLIGIYETIQKILKGDEAETKEFAGIERQVIPK